MVAFFSVPEVVVNTTNELFRSDDDSQWADQWKLTAL